MVIAYKAESNPSPRYPNAIQDCRASLKYKQELYLFESEVIAEAHFKLSLALEFASVTHMEEEGQQSEQKPFDEDLREEAARELELAIGSTKQKLQNKEVDLATMASPEDNDITRQQIVEVKEIIADMEARVSLAVTPCLVGYYTKLPPAR
jgi:HAT1-interacting factor 1